MLGFERLVHCIATMKQYCKSLVWLRGLTLSSCHVYRVQGDVKKKINKKLAVNTKTIIFLPNPELDML